MKYKRSARSISKTVANVGLAVAVSACSSVYSGQSSLQTSVPDLDDPKQRSAGLLRYCGTLHQKGNLHLAAGICNRAHELNPTDPAPLIELASVLLDLGRATPAVEAYQAALLLDPQQIDALYGLGKIYIDQRRYDLAMPPLEAAVLLNTEDSRIYNAMGIIMDQQGDHAAAQAYYRQGLSNSPRNVSLRNNLGLSLVLDGQEAAGLAMLREVAAEPESGATTGRNLEIASQIAAQTRRGGAQNGASRLPPHAQSDESKRIHQAPLTAAPRAPSDLPSMAPSGAPEASPETAQTALPDDASQLPTPLLRPYHDTPLSPSPAAGTVKAEQGPRDIEIAEAHTAAPTAAPRAEPSPPHRPVRAKGVNTPVQQAQLSKSVPAAAPPVPDSDDIASAKHTVRARLAQIEALHEKRSDPVPVTDATGPGAADLPLQVAGAPAQPEASPEPVRNTRAAETAPQSSDGEWFYSVQLGSFGSVSRARLGWDILRESAGTALADLDALILMADLGAEDGTFYRVRTAPMESKAAAIQLCSRLEDKGLDCMLVKSSREATAQALVDKICRTGSTAAFCGQPERSAVTGTEHDLEDEVAG